MALIHITKYPSTQKQQTQGHSLAQARTPFMEHCALSEPSLTLEIDDAPKSRGAGAHLHRQPSGFWIPVTFSTSRGECSRSAPLSPSRSRLLSPSFLRLSGAALGCGRLSGAALGCGRLHEATGRPVARLPLLTLIRPAAATLCWELGCV
ncbi:unnamed protein product [Rangifer tarandus platyrhynchus]|uniref:Uncharacterized protein n=3 Tax=Rangifer tarandus platyrhynchus TaxID=3082113 RepID=A0ACB0END0_RANTA|nr:unnamed protein product [Rangifer tarandus platyrhynchus]CAI9701729.1 unnamed protein product [Rangifer tarandus platyrhynchus]